jgi:hypothetical protein
MRFPTSLTQKRGSLCAAVSTAVAEATLLKSSLKSVCTQCAELKGSQVGPP